MGTHLFRHATAPGSIATSVLCITANNFHKHNSVSGSAMNAVTCTKC